MPGCVRHGAWQLSVLFSELGASTSYLDAVICKDSDGTRRGFLLLFGSFRMHREWAFAAEERCGRFKY